MDENDLILCYHTVIHLLESHCTFGKCTKCKWSKGGGDCLKQDLKHVFHVQYIEDNKVDTQREVDELFYILWENVKVDCRMGDYDCKKCLFNSSSNHCRRIEIRHLMIDFKSKHQVSYESV